MKMSRWMALSALLAAAPAGAQVVSGTVESSSGMPVPYAAVSVADRDGMVVASTFAGRDGRFTLHLPAGGRYTMRVVEDGFMPTSLPFRVAQGGSYTPRVRLRAHSAMPEPRMTQDPLGKRNGRPVGQHPGVIGGGGSGGNGGERPMPVGSDNQALAADRPPPPAARPNRGEPPARAPRPADRGGARAPREP